MTRKATDIKKSRRWFLWAGMRIGYLFLLSMRPVIM